MTDLDYSAPFPDHVLRQRRRASRPMMDDEKKRDENLTSAESKDAAATDGSCYDSHRMKRYRNSPLFVKMKEAFASIQIRHCYVWLFLLLATSWKLLSKRAWNLSSSRSSRIMRLATPSPRNLFTTKTRHYLISPTNISLYSELILAATPSVTQPKGSIYRDSVPDYDELDFDSLQFSPEQNFARYIHADEYLWHEEERYEHLDFVDDPDLKVDFEAFVDLDYSSDLDCHRLKWADTIRPTCLQFHEYIALDRDPNYDMLQSYSRRYLAHGFFRDAWLLERAALNSSDASIMVLKTLRTERDFHIQSLLSVNKEALIMERLSASPRITNIYGHCGTSMLVEHGYEISQRMVQGVEYYNRGRVSQEELDREEIGGVKPRNNLTVEEKLEIALAMSEGIAELHGLSMGYPEGVIINDDVHPDQWLFTAEGLVKFNDFNNAHIMTWNPKNSTYCKHPTWIGGDYRSPEELDGQPIDEKSDVWPMGANIFVLLSGLYPYYTVRDTKLIEEIIANDIRPYLNPRYRERSVIERGLFDIMEQCFEVDPELRIDIFSIVQHLRQVKDSIAAEQVYIDDSPVLLGLAKRIVTADMEKLIEKEAYLILHGNLDGFEVVSFGDYPGDGDDEPEHYALDEGETSKRNVLEDDGTS